MTEAERDREANLATLRAIARCGAPGSELVFSYLDQRDFDAPENVERRNARQVVAEVGEPWVSGFSHRNSTTICALRVSH